MLEEQVLAIDKTSPLVNNQTPIRLPNIVLMINHMNNQ
jgi:hypothetical protein